MSIILRLDTPALRSLIGDNEQVELQITQAAVAEICRKVIPKYAGQEIGKMVDKEVQQYLVTGQSFGSGLQLSSAFKKRLEEQARDLSSKLVDETMNKINELVHEKMEEKLKAKEAEIERFIERNISARTATFIDGKVKERLNQIMEAVKEG